MRRALSLLGALAVAGCWLDGDLKQRRTTVPEALDDGWAVATPEEVDLDPAALAELHARILDEDRFVGMTGMIVVKRGKLVWETYLRSPADRDRRHNVQSITKSVTSLVVGTAIARGELGGVEATLRELFPTEAAELEPRKQAMTLEHILTMRSGLDLDNDRFSIELWVDEPRDPLRYILSQRLFADPGARYDYRDVDPQIAGYALTRATGRSELDLARERLFDPLGISDVDWPSGRDGVTQAPHGLRLRPRDLAKLGQLVLQGGTWDGVERVPAAWIEAATGARVLTDKADDRGQPVAYGYYFWVVPGLGYAMRGHGGQFVFVVPADELVVVALAYPHAELHGSTIDEILPLVRLLVGPGGGS
ncbi:MAG: serine hydrolase [Deltaproteobacteria bacterium]|nr:serine hydrolase [Deltaproteobacteria bacterium]